MTEIKVFFKSLLLVVWLISQTQGFALPALPKVAEWEGFLGRTWEGAQAVSHTYDGRFRPCVDYDAAASSVTTRIERDPATTLYSAGSFAYDACSTFAAKGADDLVDLASPARRTHILDGEVTPNGSFGGGHRPGTGFPGKSEFPAGWSDDQIMHHISDVATDPLSTVRPGRGGDIFMQGTRDSVDIEVLIRNGEIWTGYPTSVPRNPR